MIIQHWMIYRHTCSITALSFVLYFSSYVSQSQWSCIVSPSVWMCSQDVSEVMKGAVMLLELKQQACCCFSRDAFGLKLHSVYEDKVQANRGYQHTQEVADTKTLQPNIWAKTTDIHQTEAVENLFRRWVVFPLCQWCSLSLRLLITARGCETHKIKYTRKTNTVCTGSLFQSSFLSSTTAGTEMCCVRGSLFVLSSRINMAPESLHYLDHSEPGSGLSSNDKWPVESHGWKESEAQVY